MAQLEIAVQQLVEAMDEAEQYVSSPDKLADGIAVHRDFIQTAAADIERLVANINKKNKSEAIEIPPEIRQAVVMVKRLTIAHLSHQKREKDEETEKRETAARNLNQTKETQIVLNKAPIPPLQIPPFSGNALQYKNFITIFDETVHKNSALQASQKLAYLLQYVAGDALNIIGKMPIADENYAIARDLLAENYGDESRNISTLYDRLRQLQPTVDEPYALRDLYNESESIIRVLQQAGQEVDTNAYLYDELLKKYPFSFLIDIIQKEEMSFENFRKEAGRVIKLRVRLAQRTDNIPAKYRALEQKSNPPVQAAATQPKNQIPSLLAPQAGTTAQERSSTRRGQRTAERPPPYCTFCTEQHFPDQCTKYSTVTQRKEVLKEKCHRCFQKVHPQSPCLRDQPCYYCNKIDHHRALCPQKFAEKSRTIQLSSAAKPEKTQKQKPGKFLTLLAVIQNPQNAYTKEIRICIDPASDTTVLSQAVAEEMGIRSPNTKYTNPRGLGGVSLPPTTENDYEINIFPLTGEPIRLYTKITNEVGPDLRTPDIENFRNRFPKHRDTLIPPTGRGRSIELLIGTDTLVQLVTLQKSIYVNSNNQLLSTRLGYLLLQGPEEDTETEEDRVTLLLQNESDVKQMWDLDLIGLKYIQEKESTMEEKALDHFYRNIQFIQNRYQVTWPWRNFPPNLPNNYGLAFGRLKSLHRKLVNSAELLGAYNQIISDQLHQDIVEVVPAHQRKSENITHYIPHHAIVDFQKSTPVRVVYDASTKIKGFDSLNESILKGTRWTGDIVASLLRFRKHEIAISADVKRAFHQILIKPDERDVLRFLWIKDITKALTEENIEIYRFKRMAFGIIASPFLLYAVLQHHFAKNPSPTNAILAKEMYADNLLTSLPENVDSIHFYEETRKTFSQMSMDMAKWTTNDPKLREHIPAELQITEIETSALGLTWNKITDRLEIRGSKIEQFKKQQHTKRTVLKILASLFDPLGYVLPIAVTARIFLRKLWEQNHKWDQILNEELLVEWSKIQLGIEKAAKISISRKYITNGEKFAEQTIELHTFVDASAEAYVAVTYIRAAGKENRPISFAMARGRLAPKNVLTIPRLELLAAVAGARLTQYILENLHLKTDAKTTLWSDSKCIISWINTLKILPSVIHRQVQEIRKADITQIRYVPSTMNPADIATRKTDIETFQSSSWILGPTWLSNEDQWPTEEPENVENELDDRTVMLFENQKKQIPTQSIEPPFQICIHRYSNLRTLLRRTAYCIRALNTILKKNFIRTNMEIDNSAAKTLWIRWDQKQAFPTLRGLSENTAITFHGRKIFKDDQGIIRVIQRLTYANLPEETKTPILLVKKTHLTKLIILEEHQRNMHVGTAYTLAALRRNYSLPLGRREVFSTIRTYCANCKRYNTRPFRAPPTPPLPAFRVVPTATPFKNIGIDVFGPMLVVNDIDVNKSDKKWILIITCLVVRAVHFEILHSMNTTEIIEAIRRFIARRGAPEMILSDNAPQFKLLNGVLSDIWRTVQQSEQGAKYFSDTEIAWHFIPQYAPWMGGVYERIIQTTKNAFRRTYSEKKLTVNQLSTVIVEIEAMLNNRPITYVDREENTPVITPNHFLRVQYPAVAVNLDVNTQLGAPMVTATRKDLVTKWQQAEEHLNKYWSLWTEHYLLALRESTNIVGSKRPSLKTPTEGSVVLMVDPSQRRGFWRTAIIEKLMRGGDGQARSALIRLSGGNKMIRPIVKLAPFEVAETFSQAEVPLDTTLSPSPCPPEDGFDSQGESGVEISIQLRYSGCEERI